MKHIVVICIALFVFFVLIFLIKEGCSDRADVRRKEQMENDASLRKDEMEKVRDNADKQIKEIYEFSDRRMKETLDNADKKIKEFYDDMKQETDAKIVQILKEERHKYDMYLLANQQGERKRFDTMLKELKYEKYTTYILISSAIIISLVVFFNVVYLLTPLDIKALLHPRRYEVVPKEEAEMIRLIKSYLISKNKIGKDHLLTKDEYMDILTKGD